LVVDGVDRGQEEASEKKFKRKRRRRSLIRDDCKVAIVFKRVTEGKYVIDRFYEGHTHGLATPSKKPMQDQYGR